MVGCINDTFFSSEHHGNTSTQTHGATVVCICKPCWWKMHGQSTNGQDLDHSPKHKTQALKTLQWRKSQSDSVTDSSQPFNIQ